MNYKITLTSFICLSFFAILINPLGWHKIQHVLPIHLICIFFCFISLNNLFLKREHIYYSLFVIYSILSLIFISRFSGAYNKVFCFLYEAIIFFFFTNRFVINKADVNRMIKSYIYSVICICILLLAYPMHLANTYNRYSICVLGTIVDPNYLSAYFIFPYIYLLHKIFIRKRFKIFSVVSLLIMSISLVLLGSRGTIFGIFIGTFILLAYNKVNIKKTILLSFFIVFIISLIVLTSDLERFTKLIDGSNNLRFTLWSISLSVFLSQPIFGNGANSLFGLWSNFGSSFRTRPLMVHNTYLDILTDYGILGFSLWFMTFFRIFIRAKNIIFVKAMLISTFFTSFFISAQDSFFFWINMILSMNILEKESFNKRKELFNE